MKTNLQPLRNIIDDYSNLLKNGAVLTKRESDEMEMLAVLLVDIVRHIKYVNPAMRVGMKK